MTDTVDETSLLDKAQALVDLAGERGIPLRLVGGLAIRLLTPDLPPRTRTGQDLDFASASATRTQLTDLLAEQRLRARQELQRAVRRQAAVLHPR